LVPKLVAEAAGQTEVVAVVSVGVSVEGRVRPVPDGSWRMEAVMVLVEVVS